MRQTKSYSLIWGRLKPVCELGHPELSSAAYGIVSNTLQRRQYKPHGGKGKGGVEWSYKNKFWSWMCLSKQLNKDVGVCSYTFYNIFTIWEKNFQVWSNVNGPWTCVRLGFCSHHICLFLLSWVFFAPPPLHQVTCRSPGRRSWSALRAASSCFQSTSSSSPSSEASDLASFPKTIKLNRRGTWDLLQSRCQVFYRCVFLCDRKSLFCHICSFCTSGASPLQEPALNGH